MLKGNKGITFLQECISFLTKSQNPKSTFLHFYYLLTTHNKALLKYVLTSLGTQACYIKIKINTKFYNSSVCSHIMISSLFSNFICQVYRTRNLANNPQKPQPIEIITTFFSIKFEENIFQEKTPLPYNSGLVHWHHTASLHLILIIFTNTPVRLNNSMPSLPGTLSEPEQCSRADTYHPRQANSPVIP